MGVLAVDFGGTRVRAAWYDSQLRQLRREELPSRVEDGQDAVVARIIELARSVVPYGEQPHAVGMAAPGPLDAQRGIVKHAETLPGWREVPFSAILTAAFNAPAFIENDANLAALAEYRFGAAQGADPAIYLTLSTGIGGGAVIGGRLFTGARGLAIEPGHMRFLHPDGRVYRLEELASGTALGHWARVKIESTDQPSSLRSASRVDGKSVGEAAGRGDPLALDVLNEAGRWLGLGLANLLHLLNPQAIVVGGSVAKLGELIFAPARRVLLENLLDPEFYTDDLIRPAQLGEDAPLQGAAVLAAERSVRE